MNFSISSRAVIASFLSPLLFSLIACGNGGGRPEKEAQAINEYVDSLGKLEVKDAISETSDRVENEQTETLVGPAICFDTRTQEIKNFDSFVSQGVVSKRIYPGALLDGDSIGNGLFSEIPLPKKPLTVSINLPQERVSGVMENPSLSDFLDVQQELIFAGLDEDRDVAQPKIAELEFLSTSNADELSLQLGFDVSGGVVANVDIEGEFNFDTENKRSRYLLKMVTELYTMAIDKPTFASDYFADDVDLAQVQAAFQAGNPPVYIDSVTYGRVVYVVVKSNNSAEELDAALRTSVTAGGFEGNLNFGISTKEVFEETEVEAIIVGPVAGDQQDVGSLGNIDLIGEALLGLSQREVVVSEGFFGEPVSFTVSYLTDNTQTLSSVEGAFDTETCELLEQEEPVETRNFTLSIDRIFFDEIADSGATPNRAELRGSIVVSFEGQRAVLFERGQGEEVNFNEGSNSFEDPIFQSAELINVPIDATVTVEIDLEEDDAGNSDEVYRRDVEVDIADVLVDEREDIFFNFREANNAILQGNIRMNFDSNPASF